MVFSPSQFVAYMSLYHLAPGLALNLFLSLFFLNFPSFPAINH